jgi:hypothetical protein
VESGIGNIEYGGNISDIDLNFGDARARINMCSTSYLVNDSNGVSTGFSTGVIDASSVGGPVDQEYLTDMSVNQTISLSLDGNIRTLYFGALTNGDRISFTQISEVDIKEVI